MPEPLPESPQLTVTPRAGELVKTPPEQEGPSSASLIDEDSPAPLNPPLIKGKSASNSSQETEIPPGGKSPLSWRPVNAPNARATELGDWYQGYDGYIRALRRRSHVELPVILFFRSDWCPWSRRFEREFLNRRDVANWASEQIRVVFDVDAGPEEEALVSKLGIQGLPTFLVVPVGIGEPIEIKPFPEGQALSPEEFLSQARSSVKRRITR